MFSTKLLTAALATTAFVATPVKAAEGILDILVSSYPLPDQSMAHIELYNHADYNAICTLQITVIVKSSALTLTGRVQSDADHEVQLDSHTSYAHNFYFGSGLNEIRNAWNDPGAFISEVDTNPNALKADCRPADGSGGSGGLTEFHAYGNVGRGNNWTQGFPLKLNSGFHTFETFGQTGTALEIYAPDGSLVGNDRGEKGFVKQFNGNHYANNSRVEATTGAGTYYVKVLANGPSANGGNFELQMTAGVAHPNGIFNTEAWSMPPCSWYGGGKGNSFGCYEKLTCKNQNDDWAHNGGKVRQWCRQ